jgi:hypothetical protein
VEPHCEELMGPLAAGERFCRTEKLVNSLPREHLPLRVHREQGPDDDPTPAVCGLESGEKLSPGCVH